MKETTTERARHTPAPWKWMGSKAYPNERLYLRSMSNDAYAMWTGKGETEAANAALIAAAPELLEALQDLDRVATALLAGKYEGRTEIGHSDLSISARNARAAITKATGLRLG
jgi:hypothetical protein